MIEQVLITTTADTSQAETEYVGLRQEVKLLKTQLDSLEEGTQEYNETFTKLSAKMFEQRERMQALKNSAGDLGQMLGNVSGLAGTISQGFAGATAALSLFGIENENLLRTIQKVQAFESIAKTLEQLEDAPKKIKALFNNIKGVFGSSNKLTIDVAGEAKQTTTIDTKSFKEAAESADLLKASTAAAAGSTAAAAGNQSGVTGQLQVQIPLQDQLNLLAKENLSTQKMKIDLLVAESTAKLRASVAEYNANEDLRAQSMAISQEDDLLRSKLDAKVQANQAELNTLKEYQANIEKKIGTTSTEIVDSTKKQSVVAKTLGTIWQNIGGIIKGIGIGLLISGAIYGITKLIDHFKKRGEAVKKTFSEAFEFSKEYSSAQTKAIEKELGMLKVLDAGYRNIGNNKEQQNKYLTKNKDKYKEVGVEINKILSGEISYNKAIITANSNLIERAKLLGTTSLLVQKYSKQLELQLNSSIVSGDIFSFIDKKGYFNYLDEFGKQLRTEISSLISQGFGSAESITDALVAKFGSRVNKNKTKFIVKQILGDVPDEFQQSLKENNDELSKTEAQIAKLEKQVTGYYTTDKEGGATATTSIKTYNQLLTDLLKSYDKINLNNPFTPEEARKNELFFQSTKEGIESLIFQLLKSNGSYSDIIAKLEDYQIQIIEIEKLYNQKLRDIKIDQAAWERDDLIRTTEEDLIIKKKGYEQNLKDAKESFKAGAITEKEFNDIKDKVSKATDTSILEFTKLLNKQLSSGEINFQQFRDKLNEFAGTDLTVLDPTKVDYGKLTVDNYNYLQDLISNWEDYYQKIQEANTTFKDSDKATTEEIFAVRMATIDKFSAEIERKTTEANSKISMQMNERNIQIWTVGFAGLRSGYTDVLDEIAQLQNETNLDKANQTLIQQRIDTLKEELNSETITAQKRIELLDAVKQAEADLTASKLSETERRLAIAQKEQEVRDSIFNGIKEAITDIDSVISAGYNVAEQTELNRLKKLYNAKLITQEEYTTQSEAISDKYTKKRLELEIFTGTMSAIGTSIAAFQSAVESKIPYPYNLILAGISSAAAFGSVMASVSQLQSLSIGDTSVSPTASSTGSGLTYSLNQQSATNERLLNSITDQRVYVLESDITGTQATIKEIENMSTF